MKFKIKITVTGMLVLMTMICVIRPVLGENVRSEEKVTNTLKTGGIDIEIMRTDSDEEAWENGTGSLLVPGGDVPFSVSLTNKGADCYIRIKTDAVIKKDGVLTELTAPFDISSFYGYEEDWVIAGPYLYDTEPFLHGEQLPVFEGFQVSKEMGNEYAGAEIEIRVVAEAVQSDFFVPDFSGEMPWGDLEAETAVKSGYEFTSVTALRKGKLSVHYQGGAEQFVFMPDDFFAHFGEMMPGGSYGDTISVKNDTDRAVCLFFRAAAGENEELLKQLEMTIIKKSEGQPDVILYNGSCAADDAGPYEELGRYEPGGDCELYYEITVPEEMKNPFSLEEGSVDWYFMAEEVKESEEPATPSEEPEKIRPVSETPAEPENGKTGGKKTGDNANILTYIFLAAGSVLTGIGCWYFAMKPKRRK